MRLVRCGEQEHEVPGLIDGDDIIRDLTGYVDDIDGHVLDDASFSSLHRLDHASLPAIDPDTQMAPCVASVGKFLCIGLNFYDHAKETGLPIPAHLILFMKATSSISGANDPIFWPRNAQQIDWEVELGWLLELKLNMSPSNMRLIL